MRRQMDVNSDMGESFGNWAMGDDAALFPFVTTANVACGFHAGDPVTLVRTVRLAKKNGVVVGAHPGLPDLLGFGRRAMKISPEDAYAYVVYQVGALQATLATEGMRLHHVKPHGAFYSVLKTDEELAEAVAEAIGQLSPEPMLYWPAPTDSALPQAVRKRGGRVVGEIYVDLEYAPDGSLVIQRTKHSTDVAKVIAQVQSYIDTGKVLAQDGTAISLDAESICVHGDGPNAVDVARAVRRTLEEAGCLTGPVVSRAA
jgi:5-oxoprolinase (ATP-hydrolysing) subunit A